MTRIGIGCLSLHDALPIWGMACVLTVAVVEDGCLHIGHVGDTRLYMIRANQMRKLTSDHSPVGVREEAGELNEDRKSTRLNSSHVASSYAGFCLKQHGSSL